MNIARGKHMQTRLFWSALLLLVHLTPKVISASAPSEPQATEAERLRLTLREAVQRAIAASPEVEAERVTTRRSEALLRAAEGAFDPLIRLGGDVRRETRPSSSVLEAPNGRLDEHTAIGYAGLRQRFRWHGLLLDGQVENTRQSSTNPFLSLNPYYSPRGSLTLSLPLLRGAGTDAERTELRVRQRELTASRADLHARLADIITRVETAYWQLVAASQGLAVAEQTQQAASESLSSTQRLVREGEQAAAELAGARGQLARAEEAVANAAGAERQSQNSLKVLLAASENDPILARVIDPVDRQAEAEELILSDLLQAATANRPEFRALDDRLRAQQDRSRLAASEQLPRVDLQFGYVSQGLSGREQQTTQFSIPGFDLGGPPPVFFGSTWTGFRQVRDNRYPTYSGALTIELPLRNRAAEGRYAEARLAEQGLRLQREQTRIQVALEVRQAVEALNSARDRIRAAEQAVGASSDRLAGELRLFREGQSTNLNLNVRQNELAESRQLLVRAQQGFNTAAADLLRATGRTLTTFGVRMEQRLGTKGQWK